MHRRQLLDVLDQVRSGSLTPAEAAGAIGELPYAEVAHAVGASLIDHHRELRTGVPEIVYGSSKSPEQIAATLGYCVMMGLIANAFEIAPVGNDSRPAL